jgi:DNA polymerase-3 subunit gamma/tau
MASQALYRKWRSQTFEEIVAQEHVTRTLRNALRDNRIAHAYLFAGPRGTGKTSMARLLAKAVNCIGETKDKPCNQCPVCKAITEGRALDLIEIDAASNRGIDEVRDLREKVQFRPNEFHYRVYILDEAHMLTTPAFNALLKTLEEPPEHAIFVLVTTEPHNIPITILSRCQRFDFRRIPLEAIIDHLAKVASAEGLDITEEALEIIARQASGALRDALSLLDQLMAYQSETITAEQVNQVLGTAPQEAVESLVTSLVKAETATGIRVINQALDQGAEPRQFNEDILEYLRALLLLKVGGDTELLNASTAVLARMQSTATQLPLSRLLAAIHAFNQAANEVKSGVHPRLPLEMALIGGVMDRQAAETTQEENTASARAKQTTTRDTSSSASKTGARKRSASAKKTKPSSERSSSSQDSQKTKTAPTRSSSTKQRSGPEDGSRKAKKPEPSSDGGSKSRDVTAAWLQKNWQDVLSAARARNKAVEALLNKSCEPIEVKGNMVTLAFYHDFHRQQMCQPKKQEVLEDALADVTGARLGVKCVPFRGDVEKKEKEIAQKSEEKETKLATADPVVQEAVDRYGARVTSVRPVEENNGT